MAKVKFTDRRRPEPRMTAWMLPKKFIDVTSQPCPERDKVKQAMEERRKATIQ